MGVGRLIPLGDLDGVQGRGCMNNARAYMCRAYVTVPIGECPDPYCRVRGCKRECKKCGRVTPQVWEEVLRIEKWKEHAGEKNQ